MNQIDFEFTSSAVNYSITQFGGGVPTRKFLEPKDNRFDLMGDGPSISIPIPSPGTGTNHYSKLSWVYNINYSVASGMRSDDLDQYYIQKINSGSGLGWVPLTEPGFVGYQNESTPFLAEIGDELRVTSASGEYINFLITGSQKKTIHDGIGNYSQTWSFQVIPNPNDFTYPATKYFNFLMRRRKNIDNKIIINTGAIKGLYGTLRESSDGYLIPDDFTQDNKDKVGKLIAILKGNNVFD